MTTPNVGKVELGVVINLDDLHETVRKRVSETMGDMEAVVEHAHEQIAKSSAKSTSQVVKDAGIQADAHGKIQKAIEAQRSSEKKLSDDQLAYGLVAAKLDRAIAERNKKLNEGQKITRGLINTIDDLTLSEKKRAAGLIEQEAKILAAVQAVGQARADDLKRMAEEANEHTRLNREKYMAVIEEARDAANAEIASAVKTTNSIKRENEKRARIAQALADELEKLRRKEERDAARAERAENRRQRLARMRAGKGAVGPATVLGEITRSLSGLSLNVSSGALATIAGGLLQIAGTGASAAKALFLLPAAGAAAATAMGTVALATMGFEDTISALVEGDLEKFAELIQKLSPQAQQAALALQYLGPQFKELKTLVQDNFFRDFSPMIQGAVNEYLPMAQRLLGGTASAMNEAIKAGFDFLMRGDVQAQIGTIVDYITETFRNLVPVIKPITQALTDIVEVGASLLPGLATSAVGLAEDFAKTIRELKESGRLKEIIQEGLDTIGQMADIAWDVGRALMSLAHVAEKILPYLLKAFDWLANTMERYPNLIWQIVAAVAGLAALKGIIGLVKNLGIIALSMGTTLPAAIGRFQSRIGGVFSSTSREVGELVVQTDRATRATGRLSNTMAVMGNRTKAALATAATATAGAASGAATMGGGLLADRLGRDRFRGSTKDIDAMLKSADAAQGKARGLRGAITGMGDSMLTAGYRSVNAIDTGISKAGSRAGDAFKNIPNAAAKASKSAQASMSNLFTRAIPTMATRAQFAMENTFAAIPAKAATAARGASSALTTGVRATVSAAGKGARAVGSAASAATSAVSGVGRAVGGLAAVVGLGVLVEEILRVNSASTNAIESMRDAIQGVKDARIELNDAMLESGGAASDGVILGIQNRVAAMKSELDALAQSQAGWLDMFRDGEGSLLGGIQKQLGQGFFPEEGTEAETNRRFKLDQRADEWGQSRDLLVDRFGSDLRGLDTIIRGPLSGFEALTKNFADLGPRGEDLVGMLEKVRNETLGLSETAAAVAPVFEKMGGDIADNVRLATEAFDALPENEIVNIKQTGAEDVVKILEGLGQQLSVDKLTGQVKLTAPLLPEIREALRLLGVEVRELPNGLISVTVEDADAKAKLEALRQRVGGLNNLFAGMAGAIPTVDGAVMPTPATGLPTTPGLTGVAGNLAGALFGIPTPVAPPPPPTGLDANGLPAFVPKDSVPNAGLPVVPVGDFPVPPPPPEGGAGSVSDKERREGIAAGLDPSTWAVDPFAAVGGTGLIAPTMPGSLAGANNVSGVAEANANIQQLASIIAGQFPGVNLGGVRPSDGPNTPTGHQRGVALDIGIQDQATGDAINNFIRANAGQLGVKSTIWRDQWKDFKGNQSTVGGHQDHVHVEVQEAMAQALGALTMPGGAMAGLGGVGMGGQVDQQAVLEATRKVQREGFDLSQARRELAILEADNLATEQEIIEARQKVQEGEWTLQEAQVELADKQAGKSGKKFNADDLPFGHPAKVLAGAITGAGGSTEDVNALIPMLLGNALGAAGAPLGSAAGEAAGNALSAIGPTVGPNAASAWRIGTPTAPNTDLNKLLMERNPNALASMAGFDVPDYSRQGGGAGAQNLTLNGGPANDATGRIYTDTAALIDRTFTNLDAAEKARHDQTLSVLNQMKDRFSKEALEPIVTAGVQGALEGAGEALGTSIGQSAGPIIAQAVAGAIPKGNGGTGGDLVNTGFGAVTAVAGAGIPGMADGGALSGGIPGRDSIPLLGMHGEHMLDRSDVARLGGQAGVYAFRAALKSGAVRGMATGGGVVVNDVVGAEFFGVSQIPIIGTIVNLLVKVLLKVLGIEIEARDTLDEMSQEFRDFRGDFQAFDASGRLMNDTSGLIDRSSTSEQTAADERIRILKIVIEALIKYIIEKLIVPIGKAIASSFINAGAGAAGGAIGGSFPGGSIVGGAVSSLISSAGNAAVDIGAEIFTDFALALTGVAVDAVGEGLQDYFPNIVSGLFGGGMVEKLFAAPLQGLLAGIISPIMSLFGGLGTVIPGMPFDGGGRATGMGYMPKAVVEPEQVLSPEQTRSFDSWMRRGSPSGDSSRVVQVNGDMHFHGQNAPLEARDKLLTLLDS